MEHNKEIDFSKKLRVVLDENPELEVMTLVKKVSDSVSDYFTSSAGFFEDITVEEVFVFDGLLYIKEDNYEDLYDDMVNYFFERNFISMVEAEEMTKVKLEHIERSGEWKKCIVLWILFP